MDDIEETYHAMSDSYMGYCTKCKDWTRDCTEPDAEEYDCPECGGNHVIGADNWMMEAI